MGRCSGKVLGVVAAGHEETARAAEIILQAGGNAYDAAVAAHAAACCAEPVLSSLGGGGFLLAHTADHNELVYDFFVQTPKKKVPQSAESFYPIDADFGGTTQEFHIGAGSVATPGTVAGLFAVHRDLCTIPMKTILEPAIALAKNGLTVTPFQSYLFDVVHPIFLATERTRGIFGNPNDQNRVIGEGDLLRQTQLGETLDALAREGEALFYRGEIAREIGTFSRDGGGTWTRRISRPTGLFGVLLWNLRTGAPVC